MTGSCIPQLSGRSASPRWSAGPNRARQFLILLGAGLLFAGSPALGAPRAVGGPRAAGSPPPSATSTAATSTAATSTTATPAATPAAKPTASPASAPASTPAAKPKDPRPSVAVLLIAPNPALAADLPQLGEEQIALSLGASRRVSRIVAPGDIKDMRGFEKKKVVFGCSEGDSCLAEIAGALGVDYLASAKLGRLDQSTVVYLSLIQSRGAAVRSRARQQFDRNDAMPAAIDRLAAEVLEVLGPAPEPRLASSGGAPLQAVQPVPPVQPGLPVQPGPPVPPGAMGASPSSAHLTTWIGLGAGAASAVTGLLLGAKVNAARDDLSTGGLTSRAAADDMQTIQGSTPALANALVVAGAVLVVGAAVAWFAGAP